MDAPRFDEATHRYYLGDRRVVGITEAMELSGIKPKPEMGYKFAANFAYAGERGRALHAMRHLSDIGEAGKYEFDPNLVPYLLAWESFKHDYGFEPEFSEKFLIHPVLCFGGTPDAAGYCKRLGRPIVVECKTCPLDDAIGIQLALQKILLIDIAKLIVQDRLAVKVFGDGSYKVREYKSLTDRGVGLAAITCASWRINHQ